MAGRRTVLVVGVGTRAGAPVGELRGLLDRALDDHGLRSGDVSLVLTLDGKDDEPAVAGLASHLGARLATFNAGVLAAQAVPSPSSLVERRVGTPSVAEAAVLAAGAVLLVGKRTSAHCTLAVGRMQGSA